MENYNPTYGQNQPAERSIFNSIEVDPSIKSNLAEAAKWAKFLGILGLIVLGLMFLGGLFVMVAGSSMLSQSPELRALPFGGAVIGIIYIIMGIIYIYPTWAMYKFGTLIRAGVQNDNQAKFSEGVVYLKRFFKFVGILTLIIIGLYVLIFIAGVAGVGMGLLGR